MHNTFANDCWELESLWGSLSYRDGALMSSWRLILIKERKIWALALAAKPLLPSLSITNAGFDGMDGHVFTHTVPWYGKHM